ncbi:hypothetical protein, partial [Paraburkholderia sp. SIMBA_030]|uniref:hypothetical protein n=1 Tax=Paraburkholderia sp. SIMBA_030 TaxID=3085773 RepID=UPI003979FE14
TWGGELTGRFDGYGLIANTLRPGRNRTAVFMRHFKGHASFRRRKRRNPTFVGWGFWCCWGA